MSLPEHIFKAYDIRGLAANEISVNLAARLGEGFVAYLQDQKINLAGQSVVVGYDMRATSPALAEAVISGLAGAGVSVIDIGLATTPLFNFACTNYPAQAAGIMVTASHNPAEYNGFKMTLASGLPVPGRDLLPYVKSASGLSPKNILAAKLDPLPNYLDALTKLVSPAEIRPLKIVIDFGNGMGIVTFKKLLEQFPQIKTEFLYEPPDGNFPNHEANPLKTETLKALQKKVLEVKADFGLALDGDADRIGLVDETGAVVEASYVGVLVGLEVLRDNPGAKMLYDLRSSQIVPDVWRAAGAEVEMCQVGHANIKRVMKTTKAVFASELSLHLYYRSLSDAESSDLSLLYILRVLSRAGKSLSQLLAPFKKYFHSDEMNYEVQDKAGMIRRLEEKYKKEALKISHLDGLWMRFRWGWFNLRASNTEALLRLNLEATSAAMLQSKIEELSKEING